MPLDLLLAIRNWTEADIERVKKDLDEWEVLDPTARQFLEAAIDYRLSLGGLYGSSPKM